MPDAGGETQIISERLQSGSLDFENVSLKINGQQLLSHVNCKIESSGKSVLIGANGAGKSLFLRLACGLIAPDGGKIRFMVDDNDDRAGSSQSMIFQKPVLLRRSTFANIAFVLQQKNYGRDELEKRVQNALASARLNMRADAPARKLSGGEQQRLAMARALVVEPLVLFLDEPTASLDPASTKIVEDMILDADSKGVKIIHVTHDIKQARRLADDILFMHNGQILLHQKADEFFAEPECEEAQAYLDGRIVQGTNTGSKD